ncbi:hypothetical protein PHMEG_00011940 [Phytophthora megakarya]|uniref:Uncharacterized protein n=1 Tax=Phytophthora megakarya TaxID=4795 RepID=A0A225WA01_9STRA|nr:hypothetical protein PHMEG_00011940 [Phytophthora megakarya]
MKQFFELTREQLASLVSQWLIDDGLPLNITQTPGFLKMHRGLTSDPSAVMLHARTHNDLIGLLFGMFVKHYGDILSFIDYNWRFVYLASLAVVKNDGHESTAVGTLIKSKLKSIYKLDIDATARYIKADITPAARTVSLQFDPSLQADCGMHCLNLYIGYGVGLKENTRKITIVNPITKEKIKREIVTEGGEFREGHNLIDLQTLHNLPVLSGIIDVDVRVASVVKLFQRSIVNYLAYQRYFQSVKEAKKDEKVFTCISQEEWNMVIETEAIVHRIADLILVESQTANMLSSTMDVLLRVASARKNSYNFFAYQLHVLGPRDEDTNENNFSRVELLFKDVSDLGHRTLHHIARRLPNPSVPTALTLVLDPRIKRSAKNYLRISGCAESYTDKIIEDAKMQLYVEHWEIYKRKYGRRSQEVEDSMSSASGSPLQEVCGVTESGVNVKHGCQKSVFRSEGPKTCFEYDLKHVEACVNPLTLGTDFWILESKCTLQSDVGTRLAGTVLLDSVSR